MVCLGVNFWYVLSFSGTYCFKQLQPEYHHAGVQVGAGLSYLRVVSGGARLFLFTFFATFHRMTPNWDTIPSKQS